MGFVRPIDCCVVSRHHFTMVCAFKAPPPCAYDRFYHYTGCAVITKSEEEKWGFSIHRGTGKVVDILVGGRVDVFNVAQAHARQRLLVDDKITGVDDVQLDNFEDVCHALQNVRLRVKISFRRWCPLEVPVSAEGVLLW